MHDVSLSPEAFGTLQAMKRMPRLRLYEQKVAEELTAAGLARVDAGMLAITDAGKKARKQAKDARERLKSDHAEPKKGSKKPKGR
jgi:hypothetical protein